MGTDHTKKGERKTMTKELVVRIIRAHTQTAESIRINIPKQLHAFFENVDFAWIRQVNNHLEIRPLEFKEKKTK